MIRRAVLAAVLAALAALAACATAPRLGPVDRARLAFARELLDRGNTGEALDVLARFHASAPRTAESLTLRGTALRAEGTLDEAAQDLEAAVRLDDKYAPAHAALAVLRDVEGRPSEATPHHQRALALAPDNAPYWNDWGYALYTRGEVRPAIEAFQRALDLEPTLHRARTNLGFAYARAGDFTRAAQQFRFGGTPAAAQNDLGAAYEAAGLLAPAFDAYAEAVRLDRRLSRAWLNLVNVAQATGRAIPKDLGTPPGAKGG